MSRTIHYRMPSNFVQPMPTVDLVHPINCDCALCMSFYVADRSDRLSARHKGMLATISVFVGTAIAFAYDPNGAAAALLATIGLS